MNPLVKFTIENFEELIRELGRINRPEYLFDLEDKIVTELTNIISNCDRDSAKREILKIKNIISQKIISSPNVKPILRSFLYSIEGATQAALFCL